MEKETKLQILEAAMDLAYQHLAALKAEDMGSEHVRYLLENISSLGYVHERVMYPFEPDAPAFLEPKHAAEQSEPNRGDTESKTEETETAAETPAPATLSLVEVRTVLSGVADKVDLPSLLQKFGADKLSTVDPANYAALVQAAKEAAGEA